ncbi:MAG: hypothetical protein HLUCCX14_06585 [Marinobacter excellens HL-55]|uniref:Uncharacterized protein n=1 Tax=Marinobacter excellens HL-55 TaxID=1305731 RepID=A0A0P8BM64_9GAMM|nr:MAG: hypothetical protein HLUCCX14_06585 [Marinobacter excellens HL-55]
MAEPKRHMDVPKERVLESLPHISALLCVRHSQLGSFLNFGGISPVPI